MDIKLLTERSIEHALRSIEGAEGPLIPFTFVLDANPPRNRALVLTRYAVEHLEQGLQQAQQSIAPNPDLSMYAIVWDGFATVEGRKWDAILVEVGETGQPQGAIYAQCYEAKEQGFFSKKLRNVAVGKPQLVGSVASRLWLGA